MYILINKIQNYSWGSRHAIARIFGRRYPSANPEAELWMGVHQQAPSRLLKSGIWSNLEYWCQRNLISFSKNGQPWRQLASWFADGILARSLTVPLDQWITADPPTLLGRDGHEYHWQLPFLFKILAAARPLSLQAHPNRHQAQEGFARENAAGVALNAQQRSYRDASHKPELICALSDFYALNDFRSIGEIIAILAPATATSPYLEHILTKLSSSGDYRKFFSSLLTMTSAQKKEVLQASVALARKRQQQRQEYFWLCRLHDEYPEDIGVLAPAFLNLVHLRPGQAMFTPAGRLHSYLQGVGIELMANSDNVLRGGLTNKHLDIPELLRILSFATADVAIVEPQAVSPTESVYFTPAREFQLSVLSLASDRDYCEANNSQATIVIGYQGQVIAHDREKRRRVYLWPGRAIFIPASLQCYCLSGQGVVYKATTAWR